MRFHSYLSSAAGLIRTYRGEEPLNHYLKNFFSAHKKYGSTDRRQISSLCYQYYRLGKALPEIAVEEKILLAHFLCSRAPADFLAFHRPGWNAAAASSMEEKIKTGAPGLILQDIFPWENECSSGISAADLAQSMLRQPLVFARIRPGYEKKVKQQLTDAGIVFSEPAPGCISTESATKLDAILHLNRECVIQDYNSQKVLDYLDTVPGWASDIAAWDCCAASGGKSILLADKCRGRLKLTVSDIRSSVLANLKKRMETAGIRPYRVLQTDLDTENPELPAGMFDLIICDAPCTGSGTWARTPEQLFFFDTALLADYSRRQQRIAAHALTKLKKGGLFFYITCSVFKSENEIVVNHLKEKFHLQVLQMELLKGYDQRADNMFVAVLTSAA